MNKYSKKILKLLVSTNSIDEKDTELYGYAITLIAHAVINIAVTVLIGILFNMLSSCLLLFLSFFLLRKFTGGLHAEKYVFCLLGSSVIMAASLVGIRYLEKCDYIIPFVLLLFFAFLVIIMFSPVENHNKKLTQRESKIYRIISILMGVVVCFVSVLLLNTKNRIGYPIGVGVVITSLLIIAGRIKNKYISTKAQNNQTI